MRAAEQFNAKVLSADVPLDRRPANSAKKSPKKSPRSRSPTGGNDGIAMGDLTEVLLADEEGVTRGGLANESLRYFAEVSRDHRRDDHAGTIADRVGVTRGGFAQAWNLIIDGMRGGDLISNRERSLLSFRTWQARKRRRHHHGQHDPKHNHHNQLEHRVPPQQQGKEFSRHAYLPVFVTAGKLTDAFHVARLAAGQCDGTPRRAREAEASLHATVNYEMRCRIVCGGGEGMAAIHSAMHRR